MEQLLPLAQHHERTVITTGGPAARLGTGRDRLVLRAPFSLRTKSVHSSSERERMSSGSTARTLEWRTPNVIARTMRAQ
jgi:hypothetical protein